MNAAKFSGKLVRLAALDIDKEPELWARWNRDSEYQQLLDWGPSKIYSTSQIKEWLEKGGSRSCCFSIHSLEDDKIIGFIDLDGLNWSSGDGWIGIGIGERDYWGKGYGTDAIRILLRYAFEDLNLNRVSLNVFEYNERAIKSYEKIGFQVEGRQRQALNRFDRRWDLIFMGILRSDWQAQNSNLTSPMVENNS